MQKKSKSLIVVVALVTSVNIGLWWAHPGVSASIPFRSSTPTKGVALSDDQQGILAVRSVKPAVVSISGSRPYGASGAQIEANSGTGFIISSDGYIVTNYHVVDDSGSTYKAILLDGKSMPAQLISADKYGDIALLKVEGTSMATIRWGNSDALETGQTVFAIGNALGKYQHTVTKGVVAGIDRNVVLDSTRPRYQKLIETDAAINPGNSGGPLVNMQGEVVGMNTIVEQGTGLGFSIPSNYIKTSIDQLKSFGKTNHAYVGVVYASIDSVTKAKLNLPFEGGAYITSVASGSPAEKAGLRVGDVILSVNGETLTRDNQLDTVIAKYVSGNQILLKVYRNVAQLDMGLILGEYK